MHLLENRVKMFLNLILFVGIISCAHCTGQYLGEIGCQTDAKMSGCHPLRKCTVTCSSSCGSERPTPSIWGTKIYSEDSPICLSAVHDYRISPGSSKTNVSFIRSDADPKKYLPSIQQGITSDFYRSFGGHFYFASPYFTEEGILDATTLNFKYLYQGNGSFIQSCRISGKVTTVDFEFYIPSPAMKHVAGRKSSDGPEMLWNKPLLQPGGYWCNIVNNTYSDVMSLAMASDADFLPDEWTMTASVMENIVIKFTQKQNITTPLKPTWMKDQQVLYSFPNMRQSQNKSGYYVEIDNVQSGDAGIYSLGFDDKTEKQGITRLIVRRCRIDYFGPSCDQKCPDCKNGGVCHDVVGNCICPPGFNGTYCQNQCAAGYFGQSCSQSCTSSRHAIDNSCKGAMICLPDPYGCSCAAGYKGLACDVEATKTTAALPTKPATTTATIPITRPTAVTVTAPTTSPTTATTPTTRPTTTTATTLVTSHTATPTTRPTTATVTTPASSPTNTTTTTASTLVTSPTGTTATDTPETSFSTATPSATPVTAATTPTIMSPQERMCRTVMNWRYSKVVPIPNNDCQYGCIQMGRKVVHIFKTNGEPCNKGICVQGFCQEITQNSVCPSYFNGVRRICKEYCYSTQHPGMSMAMDVRDGEFCIEKDQYGTCMNGKCVKLQRAPEDIL